MTSYDLAIIGCGPAGISAALTASSLGLSTVLLDEQPRAGGQIYRNVERVDSQVAAVLGSDYLHGRDLVEPLANSGVDVRYGTLVWDVAPDKTITALQGGRSFQIRAEQVIAATGAMERASPIPGWTLPGVMNAGAAQIALKGAGSVPSGRVVLAGGGPLLLLVACQLLEAGADVVGIVETSPGANTWTAMRHFAAACRSPGPLFKGLRMLRTLRAAKLPWFTQATNLVAHGSDRVQKFKFDASGVSHALDCDVLLLHHGVVPNTQMTRLLRIDHVWDDRQLAWHPVTDAWGQTSLGGFRIAGDGATIAGALAAEASGSIAAIGAAHALGRLTDAQRDVRAEPARRALAKQMHVRPFLDALYRPPEWINAPSDETIVCRCEEVTAGQVREMARLGCRGPNQTKFFSRCGMGPCQGRMCGLTVTQILAAELKLSPTQVGAYRIRAPLKPIPLASLAAMAADNNHEGTI